VKGSSYTASIILILMACTLSQNSQAMDCTHDKGALRSWGASILEHAATSYGIPAKPTLYPNPKQPFVLPQNPCYQTYINLKDVDSFGAVEDLMREGFNANKIAVLNMANDHYVGGGVLNGSEAQEETLCRMSNLFWSLNQRGEGPFNMIRYKADVAAHKKTKYTYKSWVHNILHQGNGVMYSPGITVFKHMDRSIDGKIALVDLITPFTVNVISSAAVDLRHTKHQKSFKELDPVNYERVMKEKIHNQFLTAIHHGNEVIVLGAFGCGAFDNDPTQIAGWYKEILYMYYAGYFKNVVFAIITDKNDTKGNLAKFNYVFTH
jgi:uncharacterized protein (TIGR02452 family)